jgi:outer membrane protein TolC
VKRSLVTLPVMVGALMLAGCASLSPPKNALQAGAINIDASTRSIIAPSSPLVHGDPVLATLLARLPDTPDAMAAQARLAETRALARAARVSLLPSLTASANGSITSAEGADLDVLDVQLSANWPLDVFGGERARTRAASLVAEASGHQLEAAARDIEQAVAQALTTLRGVRVEQGLRQRQIAVLDRIAALEAERARLGLATGRPREAARQQAAEAQARLASLANAEAQALEAIGIALGAPPEIVSGLTRSADRPQPPRIGDLAELPTAKLAARPDIAASLKLAAAAAGEAEGARADRWPRLSIGAVLRELDTNAPFAGGGAPAGASSGLTGSLLAPLFDFGRLAALEDAAKARARQQVAIAEKTTQTALNQVKAGLDSRTAAARVVAARYEAITAANRDLELASSRTEAGLETALPTRRAEVTAIEAEIAAAAATTNETSAAYRLIGVLGLSMTASDN